MSKEIDILIIFDLSAILASHTRDWTIFDQIGTCIIPQIVMDEIDFLCKRASNPDEEKTSREFTRFIVDSTWDITEILADHPSLNSSHNEDLSKNSHLQESIAKSIYGLALEKEKKLIVSVSNKQTLRNNLDSLKQKNLCTLPLSQFIQWIRTKQIPVNVNQQIQIMTGKQVSQTQSNSSSTSNSQSFQNNNRQSSVSASNNNQYQSRNKFKTAKKSNFIGNLISYLFALIGFSLVGLLIWNIAQPESFNKFWEKTGLPSLPSLSNNTDKE